MFMEAWEKDSVLTTENVHVTYHEASHISKEKADNRRAILNGEHLP
jgi:hypothetical protein